MSLLINREEIVRLKLSLYAYNIREIHKKPRSHTQEVSRDSIENNINKMLCGRFDVVVALSQQILYNFASNPSGAKKGEGWRVPSREIRYLSSS